MSHGSLRLRLAFDRELTSDALHKLTRQIMYQPLLLPPDIGSLASLIQHDFGINDPGGLALSIDTWRLPLCSSTAVLRDNDCLKVAQSSGPEPSLHVLGAACAWARGLPSAEQEGALATLGAARTPEFTVPPAQQNPKKRKREQSHAAKAPGRNPTALSQAQVSAPDTDSCEESTESESEESEEESAAPAKRPSRNARRKKHKRQLKRLGLLEGKPGRSATAPSNHDAQQDEAPRPPVDPKADWTNNKKRRRAEEVPARSHPEERKQRRETGHAKLPKRGEQWQQPADVAEFLQKGHVHFMDSDSEDDVTRSRETLEVPEPAAPELAGLTNGGISRHVSRQAPEQAPAPQRAQQAHRAEPVPRLDYDALLKPSPYPLEGDVIAYRLLHIGADWTPQVSEWREGRVLSLDTAAQNIAVEPWGQTITPQRNGQAQDRSAYQGDEEEEEQPPTEYDENGVLTTSLHSFADLRIIKDMASSMPGSGNERWRRKVEHTTGYAEEPRRDGAVDLGQLPPPPLVNGRQPGAGQTKQARLIQPHSEFASGRNNEQEMSASREQEHWNAKDSQPAQVAARSSQLAPAQQAPAERSPSRVASQARQRPRAVPEAVVSAVHHEAAPAGKALPTAAHARPMHSPLGPPVPGRAAGRSPAGFAQVAAALKARRAELAARQKALAAEQPVPPMAGIGSAKSPSASEHAPTASTSSQPQLPDPMKQASAEVAEPQRSQAAEQLDADVAEAVPSNSHQMGSSADLGPHPQSAVGTMQLQDSSAGVPKRSHGVKTRSAARQQEHATIPTVGESSWGAQPSCQPGSATELPQQEGTPEGSGQVHAKRPRASTRGSLIGPLLARLRREEEAAANGTTVD